VINSKSIYTRHQIFTLTALEQDVSKQDLSTFPVGRLRLTNKDFYAKNQNSQEFLKTNAKDFDYAKNYIRS
jgi:hypothetical protein